MFFNNLLILALFDSPPVCLTFTPLTAGSRLFHHQSTVFRDRQTFLLFTVCLPFLQDRDRERNKLLNANHFVTPFTLILHSTNLYFLYHKPFGNALLKQAVGQITVMLHHLTCISHTKHIIQTEVDQWGCADPGSECDKNTTSAWCCSLCKL